jgi:carbamoyl-phosphate synthase small subunit
LKGILALEDGTVFEGQGFGAAGESCGEVVFNTSMTGYQEVLTDPSYCSQIVTMTYPLIGNYGVNDADIESSRIQVAGFVVKEVCPYPSNFRSQKSLSEYLKASNVVGVSGVDTRKLTRHTRLIGAMKGIIWAGESPSKPSDLVDKAKAWKGLVGVDIVKNVTCRKPYEWDAVAGAGAQKNGSAFKVVAFDFGIKFNILRILKSLGCAITVVPASTTMEQVMAYKPDGVFLSNGPGDPAAVTYAIETIKKLRGKLPIFGICLGHQLCGLALGAKTYKLKFGHRGANHPVKNLTTGGIAITSQNHGFCVDSDSLKAKDVVMTHVNLNDRTCEGLSDMSNRLFCVQYHPEASPGPHDSGYLFKQFIDMMGKN